MRFEELKPHLKNGKYYPCYVLKGEDSFLLESAQRSFMRLGGDFCEFNTRILENVDAKTIVADCHQFSLMGGTRVVMVKNFALKAADQSILNDYLKDCNPDCVLVFVTPQESAIPFFENRAEIIGCDTVSKNTITKWINRECQKADRVISDQNIQRIIDACGGKMQKISIEFGKLCCAGVGKEITADDIDIHIVPVLEYKIYELSDKVSKKQNQKALDILQSLLNDKNEPSAILNVLYSHFRRLMFVSLSKLEPAQLAKELAVREGALNFAFEQAKRFSQVKLKKICEYFYDTEYGIKSGRITPDMAVRLSVLKILDI